MELFTMDRQPTGNSPLNIQKAQSRISPRVFAFVFPVLSVTTESTSPRTDLRIAGSPPQAFYLSRITYFQTNSHFNPVQSWSNLRPAHHPPKRQNVPKPLEPPISNTKNRPGFPSVTICIDYSQVFPYLPIWPKRAFIFRFYTYHPSYK